MCTLAGTDEDWFGDHKQSFTFLSQSITCRRLHVRVLQFFDTVLCALKEYSMVTLHYS